MVLKPKIPGWLQKLNCFHQNTTWTLWLSGVFFMALILFNRIIKKLILNNKCRLFFKESGEL